MPVCNIMAVINPKNPECAFTLAADLDDTLVPIREHPLPVRKQGHADLNKLARALSGVPHLVGLGTATGNNITAHDRYITRIPAFEAFVEVSTFKITSVGTVLHRRVGNDFLQDTNWPPPIDGWRRSEIAAMMDNRGELELQPLASQSDHKLSYTVTGIPDSSHAAYVAELRDALEDHDLAAQVNFSSGEYLDFLPTGIHKGSPYEYLIDSYEAETGVRPAALAADNSMNGAELLLAADFAILPGNADDSLRSWARATIPDKTYEADRPYAAGILEGLHYAGRIGLINFPAA